MSFKVGDAVVYPHHGVAVIEGREQRRAFGENRHYLVLHVTHDDLTLLVPVDGIDQVGVREIIGAEEATDVLATLAKRDAHVPLNWSRRFKNHMAKLKSGDIYQVAEVVRNLTCRGQQRPLSAGEKRMLGTARRTLVAELSIAMRISDKETDQQIDAILARSTVPLVATSPEPSRPST
ncbi:MAG: CarD family transcriptional regulator [Actinobacteria bacterium]|nr:MAG: CarD family transcriptional regulator [Actinomycetota bacterium]